MLSRLQFIKSIAVVVVVGIFGAVASDARSAYAADAVTEGIEAEAVTPLEICVGAIEARFVSSMAESDPLTSSPAEMQTCLNACKAGGAAMLSYCNVFLDPRIKALCAVAAGGSFVACSGFCYARFAD